MAQIRLAPGTGNEITIPADEIQNADFVKTHTGLSDFQITVQRGLGIADNILDEIRLEKDDGTLLFRGLFEKIDEREGQNTAPTATLQGVGPGYRLKESDTEFTVSNELMHNAIDRFFSNETVLSPVTVTTPSVNNTTTGTQAQEASTTAEFSDILTVADDEPLAITNDEVQLLQSSFTQEGESGTSSNTLTNSDGSYSDGEAEGFNDGGSLEWTFTNDYEIPTFEIYYRNDATGSDVPRVTWSIDVNSTGTFEEIGSTNQILSLSWDGVYDTTGADKPSIPAGTHTIKAEGETGTFAESRFIDVIAPLDDTFSYTFDNDNGGSSGYLDGPELFPDQFETRFTLATTSYNVTDGTL
jgi:hypothetical protein